jgi:hypothetical protein
MFLFFWISINMDGAVIIKKKLNMDGAVQHGVDGVLRDRIGVWIKRFAKNIGTQLLPLMLNNGV